MTHVDHEPGRVRRGLGIESQDSKPRIPKDANDVFLEFVITQIHKRGDRDQSALSVHTCRVCAEAEPDGESNGCGGMRREKWEAPGTLFVPFPYSYSIKHLRRNCPDDPSPPLHNM